jgi:hypothetical protein
LKLKRLGISEDEKMTLGDQVDSFTYRGRVISKDGGIAEHVKSKIVMAKGVFSQLKKVGKNRTTSSSHSDSSQI